MTTTLHDTPAQARPTQRDPHVLLDRYAAVRAQTEALAAPLSPEDQTVQSMPDVSPTKWHRAHVTWFFETFVLADHESGFTPFQEHYWFLFNSYYEAVGPRYERARRGDISRPGAHDVGVYRGNVDARMHDLLDRLDEGTLTALADTVELGFHHEQQHQELLLMDIKHVLSRNPLRPVYAGVPQRHRRARPARLGRRRGRAGRDRPPGRGLRLRQRAPPPPAVPRALPPRRPAGHQRRVARVHGRRWLPPPRPVALRRLGPGPRGGLGGAVLLDPGRRPVVRALPQRHLAGQPRPAGRPRQLLRGRGLRRLGRQAAPERGRVGARRRDHARRAVRRGRARRPRQPRRRRDLPPPARRRGDRWAAADVRRLLGVDLLGLPPLPGLPPGRGRDRRVQRQVHVQPDGAARRLCLHPRAATPAPPTATSSPTAPAGRCPGCGWPTGPRPRRATS